MRLSITPSRLVVAPGEVARLEVSVINDGDLPLLPDLAVRGVDPVQVLRLDTGVELAPGEVGAAVVEVRIPVDAIAGDMPFAIAVTDMDSLQEPELVVVPVEVGGRPPVSVEVDPPTVYGRRTGRLDTLVRNHGPTPLDLELSGASEGADVRFVTDRIRLGVGEALAVATSIHRRRRTWFREVRHGILIDVRGRGAPVAAGTTFVQRPLFPPWLLKGTALLLILGLWAGAVVAVADRIQRPAETVASEVEGDTADGEDAAGQDGDAEGDAAAEGEDAADDEDPAAEGDDAAPAPPVVLAGEVTGPRDPAGTRIIVERLAFGDPGTTGEGTKVAALTPVFAPVGAVVDRIETATDDRGRFGLTSGLATSAFYRVAAVREGFELAAAVIRTEEEPAEYDVLLELVPAPGAMSGRVVGTDGVPIGGAEVLISGGDLAYRTVTGSDGAAAGTWSIEGIAAAPAYAVTFRAQRFASATVVRSLAGGERLTGVDAELIPDRGSIRGLLSSRGEGVGAVTVDLVGEGIERSTTTLTADGVEGTFDLPALPFGTYQLTFSAPGWLTQTTEVVVDRGDVVVAVGDLQASTATIQGFVQQEVAPGGCAYPDPADPTQRDDAVPTACGGVGVTLVGDTGTFSTTTATGTGSFTLSSIPPGTYTAAFERFGYQSQFLQLAVGPGDVLSLPDDAAGAVVAASAVAFRTAASSPIIMRLVPPPTEGVGQLQGVLRSAIEPTAEYAPPVGTIVQVADQPDAEIEVLPNGTVRATGLVPGALTLQVRAPGHDAFSTVVRVGGTEVAEAGTLLLTPLATLALRLTDSEELPIGGADVFLTTDDPADLANAVLDASIDPAVEACTVDRDAAGRWRITSAPVGDSLTGLCSRVSDSGDVSFRQAVGTGSYRLVTPVNEVDFAEVADLTDPEERAARARVVPLDHEQLERLVEVRSGETTRIDLRARRYAVLEGRIRKPVDPELPSGAGFLNAVADDFVVGSTRGLEAFPDLAQYTDGIDDFALGVGLTMIEDGLVTDPPTVPPAGLGPRISFGPADGLPEGVYRINRVLPSTTTTTRDYEVEFFGADGGKFAYVGANALTSFGFAETRSANAVLLPSPIEVDVRVVRELRSGIAVEVEGVAIAASGIVEYVYDGGSLLKIAKSSAGVTDSSGVAVLRADGEIQPYVQSELLDITATKVGFDTLEIDEIVPSDGQITIVVTPVTRTVRGTVEIFPAGASLDTTLSGLAVALQTVGGATVETFDAATSPPVGGKLVFTVGNVAPDDYQLVVSGGGIFDVTTAAFSVPPGPSGDIQDVGPDGGAVAPPPFLVDAELDLAVAVTESFTDVGATGPAILDVAGATVELFLNGAPEATATTGAGGEVLFPGLRGGDPVDAQRDYTLEISAPGYRPFVDATPFVLDTVDPEEDRALVRFGAARATVISVVTPSDTSPLEGATAGLLDTFGNPVEDDAGAPITFTSDVAGLLVVPATTALEPGDYQLAFTATNHDGVTVPVTITDASIVDLGNVELERTRADVSGTVTDDSSGNPPLANVRVQATTDGTSATSLVEDVTGADGTYALPGLPPQDLVLLFEEFADAAATIPTSRRAHTVDVSPAPGATVTTDLTMAREFVAISGTASSRDFDHPDAPTAPLVGATVTATCVSGVCLGATPTVLTTTTGAGGAYAFDVLNAGTYDLVFTADGHDTPATRVALVVRFGDDLSTVTIDEVLIATPIDVPVTADSDRFPDLAGVTVVATYVPPSGGAPVPTTTTDGRYVLTGVTGAAGAAVPLVLPPGEWTIETTGATDVTTAPRPHRDGTATRTLAADGPTTPVALAMPAYVEVAGTVRSRPHTLAASTELAGATAVPTATAGEPTAYPVAGTATATAAAGAWTVLLPPTVGGSDTTWEVVLAADDHESAALDVTLAAGDGDVVLADPTPAGLSLRALGDLAPAFVTGTGGVALTAAPVAQPVLVTSAFDADVLDGVSVVATWDVASTTDPAPPAAGVYDVDVTSAAAAVDLQLAPGPWILTTAGADTAAGLPGRPPHKDAPGTSVTPTIGGTQPTETLALVRWASITGSVETVAYAGATPVSPTDATAAVTVPAAGVAEAGTDADDVDGQWRVWIPDPAAATVTLSKPGFAANTASVTLADFAGGRDVDVATPVTLTAGEREVVVTVASSVSGGVTDGATLVATDPNPTDPLPSRTALVVGGVATFPALEPIEWRFTTTDAPDLPEPHKDLPAADDVRRTIPAGTGTYAIDSTTDDADDEQLELVRYASVTGTVGARTHPTAGLVARDDVAISVASPATAVPEPLSEVDGVTGRWRIWLPDEQLTSIQFELGGHGIVLLDVVAGASRDITVATPVSLVAIPRKVDVLVVSEADGSPLVDVDVTATSAGLTSRTAVTDSSGIASFSTGTTDRRLAPVTWRFTTSRAPAHLPPHIDVAAGDMVTRPVPVGVPTDPDDVPVVTFDSTTTGADDARLELERYAVLRGSVGTQAYSGAPVVPTDAATLDVRRPTSGAVAEGPGADGVPGRFRVWVEQPLRTIVDFELTGYDDVTVEVQTSDFTGDEATGDAVLVGKERTVDVTVLSSDGSALEDVDVVATGPAGAPGPFTATSNSSGVARFSGARQLAPTTWTFTTAGAVDLDPPHEDLTAGPPDTSEERDVAPGTGTFKLDQASGARERLTLTKYALLQGLVKTRGVAGGPETVTETATVTETTSTGAQVTSPGDQAGPDGQWQAWVPEGASPSFDFEQTAHGTESRTYTSVTGAPAVADVVLTAGARPVTVTAVADEDATITFADVEITLTGAGALPDHTATTGSDGVADFGSIEPIQYAVTTSGADAYGRDEASETLTVTPGATTQAVDLGLTLGTLPAAITGDAVEYVSGAPVTIAGVTVTGTRGNESYDMSASTAAASDNYSLQLPAGTWLLEAARATGPSVVVDAAYVMPTDGTGPAPTVVMPTAGGPDLTGTVTTAAGDPVEDATVTAVSSAQTRTTTSDENGDYALLGLDPGVTWAVTYTPPSGVSGVAVTRFVAPGGSGTDITLSQEVPTALGSIRVDVTDGPADTEITVTLTETGTPFKTVDADGIITDTVTLNSSGVGSVTFSGLVPGDDVSIPHDRFDVSIDTAGYESFSDTGNEVTAGATTVVAAALVALPPPTREVVLTVDDPDGDAVALASDLTKGSETISGTVTTGGVHTFAAVEADATWTLEIAGYDDLTVPIPAGTTSYATSVTVTPTDRDPVLTLTDETGDVTATPVLSRLGFTDVTGTATSTVGEYAFTGVRPGDWTLTVPGYDTEDVSIPLAPASADAALTLVTLRDPVLTLEDSGGPVTGLASPPELQRTGYTAVAGTESTTTVGDYAFTGVAPGTWTLVTPGYTDETVVIPAVPTDPDTTITLTP